MTDLALRDDGQAVVVTQPTSMVDKVVMLLCAFAGDDELTLTELSRRTGIAKSTAHRLVGILRDSRLVEQVGTRYSPGLLLFELGSTVRVHRRLREAAMPFLEDLYEATHEIVHLAVRDGHDVLYVEKLSGHTGARSPSRVGGRMPLHCTGVGKALLAFAPPDVVDDVLTHPLAPRTRYTVVSPHLLADELRKVRATGVAFDREEAKLGLACAAAPLLDADGTAIAAVSVSGPCPRVAPERLAHHLKTAVRRLRAHLIADRHHETCSR